MKKSNMRSRSETKPGKITASHWLGFVEHDIKFKINVMIREYFVNEKLRKKTEYVILIDTTERPRRIILTEFGPTCGVCLTSDYIKEDSTGSWFDKKSQGCTCTRCGSGTLQS